MKAKGPKYASGVFLVLGVLLGITFATTINAATAPAAAPAAVFPPTEIRASTRSQRAAIRQWFRQSYSRIRDELGYAPRRFEISAFDDYGRFLDETGRRDVPSGEKLAGLALPEQGRVYIALPVGDPQVTLAHEVAHVVFLQSLPPGQQAPFWFVEGLAAYQSRPGTSGPDVEKQALSGDIPTMSSLVRQQFVPRGDEGKVAAQGFVVVEFLAARYGEDSVFSIVHELQAGRSFEDAAKKATGLTTRELDDPWRAFAQEKERTLAWSELRYFGWLVLPVFIAAAYFSWLVRRRRRLEALGDDDNDDEGGLPDHGESRG